MTLDASFSVEGSSAIQGHEVAYAATVDLVALSNEWKQIEWSIASSSKTGAVAPTITLGGSVTGATASFPQVADPGDGLGRAWVVKCLQRDGLGNTAVAYRVVGTVNSEGYLPICADEKNYRDATHGWSQVVNEKLAEAGGGGTLSAPADPGDDGKVAIASGGDLSYVAGSAAGQVLVWTGASEWAAGAVNLADTDAVTNRLALSNFSNLNALSVLGVAGNVGGEAASIEATNDNHVLRRSGTSIGFGTIAAGGIASNAVTTTKILDANVTFAKIENGSACSLLGVAANSSGAHASIAAGTNGFVFCRRTNVVTAALLLNENIDSSAAIAHSKLANITQGRVLGRADATGAPQELVAQNGVATNGTDDSLVLVDETTTGGILINLGKTASTWRAIGPTSTRFNADAAADFSTASPATVRGIITNSSLLADRDIDITPADYHTGTILNVIYLHNSGVAFGYQFDVVGGTLNPTGAIAEPDGVDLADWLTDSKITASCSLDFQVRNVTGTEDDEKELVFLGGQLLLQTSTAGF